MLIQTYSHKSANEVFPDKLLFGVKFTSSLSKHIYTKSPKHTYHSFSSLLHYMLLYSPFFYAILPRSLGLFFIIPANSSLIQLLYCTISFNLA